MHAVTYGVWQHAINNIDEQLNKTMKRKYLILNKKLDKLLTKGNGTVTRNINNKDIHTQQRIINLTDIKLTKEQTQLLNLGPNYAIEMEPKKYLNDLITLRMLLDTWTQKCKTHTDT